jgi:hypothetical protein
MHVPTLRHGGPTISAAVPVPPGAATLTNGTAA